jgi:molybdopterin/thiamine biosynthesis adenylyltransferase
VKKVIIVGGGAIGSRTAKLFSEEELQVIVIDRDVVMPENLKNQLFKEKDIGIPKAFTLKNYFRIKALAIELTSSNVEFLKADLVIDCTDNLVTRRIINNYCFKQNIPWIHGAAIKNEYVVLPIISGGFGAVYKGKVDGLTCEEAGLIPEAAEKVAELQYSMGMKILSGKKVKQEMIRGTINGKEERYELPNKAIKEELTDFPPTKLCGRGMWQFRRKFSLDKDYEQKGDCWLFKDGRILVKAETEKEAEKKIKKII